MRRKRKTRCFNCGELSVKTHNVYQFKSDKELEEYRKVKYDYRTNIMDYLDKSKKSFFLWWLLWRCWTLRRKIIMKTKFVKIKCMAKNCQVNIIIQFKKTWYLENNKRVYTYDRDNKLSFCQRHTEEFNNALAEMKISQHKNIINNQLKTEINKNIKKEFNKYK